MTKLENYNDTIFESIKHTDENGSEYWYARELMIAARRQAGEWYDLFPGAGHGHLRTGRYR